MTKGKIGLALGILSIIVALFVNALLSIPAAVLAIYISRQGFGWEDHKLAVAGLICGIVVISLVFVAWVLTVVKIANVLN